MKIDENVPLRVGMPSRHEGFLPRTVLSIPTSDDGTCRRLASVGKWQVTIRTITGRLSLGPQEPTPL